MKQLITKVKWCKGKFNKFESNSEKTPEKQLALNLLNEVEQESNSHIP